MDASFSVKIGEFEGPLELLLNLIEERRLLISDISLSSVAEDFLSYLQAAEAFPIGAAAHFIAVAATLLLLKSRALLPVLSLTKEEEGDVKDLEFRLKLYQAFRIIARDLGHMTERMFFGSGMRGTEPVFAPSRDLSLASLSEAAEHVLQNAPRAEKKREVAVTSVMSLEEMIDRLSDRISKAMNMTFREFAGSSKDRRELVVGFLAILELFKRGFVRVEQDASFGEIAIAYNGEVATPRF